MRDAFSDSLVEIARSDPNVLLLTGDHGYALFDAFRHYCPGQYINAGIAEQNMVGMAAGLARVGFKPFVYGLSAFVPIRVLEQIKLDVAHDDLPVIFVGDGAGFVYSHLGTSHQSTEDIAATRAIPGLSILSPCDRHEVGPAMLAAYRLARPVYFRMGKSDRGDVHAGAPPMLPGSLLPVRVPDAATVSVLATGSMVRPVLDVVEREYPNVALWSVPWIRPLDERQIVEIASGSRGLVVVEEHSVHGGLGSLITEITSEHAPSRVLRIGVPDRFSEHCGTYDYLLREHGLDVESIRRKLDAFIRAVDG